MNDKLGESLKYFQFIQDCDDLKEWLDMKTLQAQDDTYRDTANIHTKYLRHQAFQAEILSNKERLLALKSYAEQLKSENYQQIDANLIVLMGDTLPVDSFFLVLFLLLLEDELDYN